jgi:hypothetical protein
VLGIWDLKMQVAPFWGNGLWIRMNDYKLGLPKKIQVK